MARSIGPAWQRSDMGGAVISAREKAEAQRDHLESDINALIDRLYILYYDRRASAPQATPTAEEEGSRAEGTPQPEGSTSEP
ncbi:MAG: hypothetical protein J7M34_06930 [Anaerolineae bacterium]|nr:hypothetical protein [Anaerolineae bacterium]